MSKPMPERVPSLWFLLVKKFYQTHYPNGKPNKADPIWVIKEQHKILSAVRLKQFNDCQLLMAMVTDPSHRGRGFGTHLLTHIRDALSERPCYCFAFLPLEGFYQANGFITVDPEQLPNELLGRFNAYTAQGRLLVPMRYSCTYSRNLDDATYP